jgi:hypothetical protein
LRGRRGIGAELKPSYFKQAVLNVAAALQTHAKQEGLILETVADGKMLA